MEQGSDALMGGPMFWENVALWREKGWGLGICHQLMKTKGADDFSSAS